MAATSTRLVLVLQVQGHKALGYPRERVMVGRGSQANFQILDQHVASEHLEIHRKDRTIWVKDLGSVYGTQLNGMMMVPGKPVPYKEGDRLVLGRNVALTLSVSEVPERESKNASSETESGPAPEKGSDSAEPPAAPIERTVPPAVRLAHSLPYPQAVVFEGGAEEEEITSVTEIESLPDLEESPENDEDEEPPSLEPRRSVAPAPAPVPPPPPAPTLDLEFLARAGEQLSTLHQMMRQIHKTLDSEKRELADELTSLREQLSTSRSELATIENTKAQVRKENEILSARYSEVSTQLRSTQQEHAQLTRLVEQENQALTVLREQVKDLDDQALKQRNVLETERIEGRKENIEHFSRTEGRIAGIAQALSELQKSAGQDKRNLTIELSQLRVQITGGMGELSSLEDRKNGLYEQCESARGQLTDLNTQVHAAEAQYGELQKKLTESGFALDKARGDLQRLEQETAEQQKIFELERQLTLKESTEFRAKVEAHTTEIQETLRGIQASVDEEKRQFHRQLEHLQTEVQSARFELSSLEDLKNKLTIEIDKCQVNLGESAEQIRLRQIELADATKKCGEQKRESESLAREVEKQRGLVQRAQQDAEQASRQLELQKEKQRLDLQQLQTEITEERQVLEGKAGKLRSVVEQLEVKKHTLEETLSTLSDTKKGIESQIEGLRSRELLFLEGNQKAQTTHETLARELESMQAEHEEATLRKSALNQELEALARSREDLATQEAETRTSISKLNDEMSRLETYFEEQKEQRLQVAKAEAERQAETILQTARDEAKAFREKENLELEREIGAERERLKRELADERNREEGEFRKQKEKHQNDLQVGSKAIQQELAEKRALVEQEIGERLAVERRNRELREEAEERGEADNRQARIIEISKGLEHAIGTRFQAELKHGGELGDRVQGTLNQIKQLVERAFDPDSAALGALELKIDVASKKRAGRFWLQLGCGVGAAGLLIAALVTSRERIANYFSSLGNEPEPKIAATTRPRFHPATDGRFKSNYTDNVLYTRGYKSMKLTPITQKRWIVELNHFFLTDLKLDEKAIVKFAAAESTLIQELTKLEKDINPSFEKAGIQRLREAETSSLPDLTAAVGGEDNFRREREFEANFYAHTVLGSREQTASATGVPERVPASDDKHP